MVKAILPLALPGAGRRQMQKWQAGQKSRGPGQAKTQRRPPVTEAPRPSAFPSHLHPSLNGLGDPSGRFFFPQEQKNVLARNNSELRISLSGVPLQLEVCPFGPSFLLFTVFNTSHKPPHVHRPVHLPCILASQTQSSSELPQFTWITGISLTAAPRCRTKQSQPTSPRFAIDQQSETRQVFLGVAQY